MPPRRLIVLLLAAAVIRVMILGWDSGIYSPHPDERRVAMTTMELRSWFDDPGFYSYGSLHFQAVRGATALLGMAPSMASLIAGGRVLSLMASLLALVLGWWMAQAAWGRRTADLFLLLTMLVPLDLQQSHFATVEAHHALWVVATLAASFQLARRPGPVVALVAGACFGASLAVKVASLPLVLAVVAACLLGSRGGTVATAIRWLALAAVGTTVSFWLGQSSAFAAGTLPSLLIAELAAVAALAPATASAHRGRRAAVWAGMVLVMLAAGVQTTILFGPLLVDRLAPVVGLADRLAGHLSPTLSVSYLTSVIDQVNMVSGREPQPYVMVYRGTPAVLYSLRELGAWGLGPGLLASIIFAAGAAARHSVRRWRRWLTAPREDATILLVLLLLWLGPMAVRLATLEVKFLRYWQPLVVPAALLAAWALIRLPRRRWRRPVVIAVTASTMALGVLYLAAFSEPHPHRTATEWLDLVVDPGDNVAFEDWDEHLELTGDETGPGMVLLPSYGISGGDSGFAEWCVAVAASDWVVLTSNRVRRTVLGHPELFPDVARLYEMLFRGDAGFEAVTRVDRGPRLLGLELPVQWADESFVNYEFPRVVVFRRVEAVDAVELQRRAGATHPPGAATGWAEFERRTVAPLPEIEPIPGGRRQLRDVGVWAAVLLALGLAAWVVILPVVHDAPDGGLGLALATGWVFPAWLMWLGSELGLWPVGAATATVILLAEIALAALVAVRRRELIARVWLERRRAMVLVAAAALVVGGFFLVVRALNPAIAGGEKPMDFSFLNAFAVADAWPTGEPWMAGKPLYYYYFGEVLSVFPILLTGCRTAVGYNLAAATVPALAAALLTAFGLIVARGRRGRALVMPLLVLLSGNLAWPWMLEKAQNGRFFDLWWATSRVIPSPYAIEEFPLWTAFFADLHGHFIALPVLLGALLWGWTAVRLDRARWPAAALFCGLFAGVLAATNPWDLLVLTAALGFGVLAAAPRSSGTLLRLATAAGASLIVAAPFLVELAAGIRAGVGGGRGLFPTTTDFAPWWAVALHFGLFLGPLAVLAVTRSGRWFVVTIAAAGIGGVIALQMGSSAAALTLMLAALFMTAAARATSLGQRLGWTFALLGVLLVALCERLTLIDRMNTVFKIYNGVWLLLALALGLLLLVETGWRRRLLWVVWLPLELAALVNLPLGVAQGLANPLVPSPRPTLDGQAYLRRDQPDTWFLVRSVEALAGPDDAVAEATGEGYGQTARIVMHTGRPTVVGWPWHLTQRGQSPDEIVTRQNDLETLYGSADPVRRREVIDRYDIRWIGLGQLEREIYQLRSDNPFREVPGVVRMTSSGRSALYQVQPAGPSTAAGSTSYTAVSPSRQASRQSSPSQNGNLARPSSE